MIETSQQQIPIFDEQNIKVILQNIREELYIVNDQLTNLRGIARTQNLPSRYTCIGRLPACYPEWLGEQSFLATHGVRFPYICGEMANGIATSEMVVAMAKAQMLAFFGAAGLSIERIENNLLKIKTLLQHVSTPWGANLIHSPADLAMENATVELFLKHQINRVSASAFMQLTPSVVRYASSGLHRDHQGYIQRKNYLFAKISQPHVARLFMSPAPAELLQKLVAQGQITTEEANLALEIPLCEDITVESDSGGHTDNRPLAAILPIIMMLKQEICNKYHYQNDIRIGAAGGIGTPQAVASAFALGASYVLTGSINQATQESGLSERGKRMLTQADVVDVMMAPAADMFEMGVNVQVLKRGCLFPSRARLLYSIYKQYNAIEEIDNAVRDKLEQQIFKNSLEHIWQETIQYFRQRKPEVITKAEQNSKYKMALIFRWYLGNASHWAIRGEENREVDYQIWCGPAMGAFNQWVAGTFLEPLENRNVVQIARNLLEGATVITRAQQLRNFGVQISNSVFHFVPRQID